MWHPLAADLSGLKEDELQAKIIELNKKISMAYRLGSRDAMTQMQMLLQNHNAELQQRYSKRMEEMAETHKNFSKLIDIK